MICDRCGKDFKNLGSHLRFCRNTVGELIEPIIEPKSDKVRFEEIIMTKDKEEETKTVPGNETQRTVMNIVVADISMSIDAAASLQDVGQVVIDVLKNISELRAPYIEEATEHESGAEPEGDPQDLEGDREYMRLMENIKETPAHIPELPKKTIAQRILKK